MRKIILFDLDGTLIESGEGIINSLHYAIEKMGLPEQTSEDLRVFIGPPLLEQFMSYFDLTKEEAKKAVTFYHERYHPVGLYEGKPYQGIEHMLKELSEKDYILGVASSKPQHLVEEILQHVNYTHYFTLIVGSGEGDIRNTKRAVIKEALREVSFDEKSDNVWMVGDKEHDVLGAREVGVPCVSVLYGYGTKEEIESVSPLVIVQTVEKLHQLLLTF